MPALLLWLWFAQAPDAETLLPRIRAHTAKNLAGLPNSIVATAPRDLRRNGAALIPKGARFTLRITRLRKFDGGRARPYYIVGVQLEAIESGGSRSEIRAHLEEVTFANRRYYVPFARQPGMMAAPPNAPVAPPSPGEGVVLVRGDLRLAASLRMVRVVEER